MNALIRKGKKNVRDPSGMMYDHFDVCVEIEGGQGMLSVQILGNVL